MRLERINGVAAWSAVLTFGLVISTGCSDRDAAERDAAKQSQSVRTAAAGAQPPVDQSESRFDRAVMPSSATGGLPGQAAQPAAEPPSLASTQPEVSPPPRTEPMQAEADSPLPTLSTLERDQLPTLPPPSESPQTPAPVNPLSAQAEPKLPTARLQLRSDLSVERLVDFLRSVDVEMQSVATGRKGLFDVDEANAELIRLAKLKLQAAEQLEERAEAESPQQVTAIRGKLQSLSHLAALGDLAAAQQLETVALQHAENRHPAIALDSRLVLVGLAMERLQNGAATDADELLGQIEQIGTSAQAPDVSALMVMGQARAVLQQYGYDEAAQRVRTMIVDLFANHPNPDVGAMALQLVGSGNFSQLNELLRNFERREPLTVEQWKTAAEALLDESADMAAVQFLASAALQFEAFGGNELADATFEVLSQSERFSQEENQEIAVAVRARKARSEVIGKPVSFDLPSVDGRPLSLATYSGKVVLMPFWAVAFPDSLRVLQTLDQIRDQFGGQVEIIGMNLDPADAPADEFLRQSPVQFRSFESVTPAGAEANPIATRFGVVSLPFILIIAPDGTAAAINLTGQGLESQVKELLAAQ